MVQIYSLLVVCKQYGNSIMAEVRLVCVHCGCSVNALFKQYGPSVLKLINCNSCLREADKYIEYDNVIILIDLILFKTEAYRHIIYNSQFKNHWKLAILVLLMKTYDEWATHCYSDKPGSQGPMVLEQTFYSSFIVTLTGSLVNATVVIVVIGLHQKTLLLFDRDKLKLYWKGIVLSSFGQFLVLPSLIWMDLHRQIHVLFIAAYTLLSQMQALSVVCKLSRPGILVVLWTALFAEYIVVAEGRNSFHISQMYRK